MNKLPTSAAQLNDWIRSHFSILEATRGYVEFTFPVTLGFDNESTRTETIHRVVFIALAYEGRQSEVCAEIASQLEALITKENFIDARELLFVRDWFDYSHNVPENGEPKRWAVYGRLAFWDTRKNKKLMALDCYKPQGALVPKFVAKDPDAC